MTIDFCCRWSGGYRAERVFYSLTDFVWERAWLRKRPSGRNQSPSATVAGEKRQDQKIAAFGSSYTLGVHHNVVGVRDLEELPQAAIFTPEMADLFERASEGTVIVSGVLS
jgi:hypothetical protein